MSSNARPPTYAVKLRGISPDLQELGPEVSVQGMGLLDSDQLVALLKAFAALDPVRLVDADPHVLLTGIRGGFSAKPHQGKLLLQSAGGSKPAFIALAPADVPTWLDDADAVRSTANGTGTVPTLTPAPSTGRNLALGLLFVSLLVLTFSAHFTFRPHPLIPEDNFRPIADKVQLSRLQQQVVGLYAQTEGHSTLLVTAEGKIIFTENHESDESPDLTTSSYVVTDLAGTGPVLRTADFGAIIVRTADTLVFYGEEFVRKNK